MKYFEETYIGPDGLKSVGEDKIIRNLACNIIRNLSKEDLKKLFHIEIKRYTDFQEGKYKEEEYHQALTLHLKRLNNIKVSMDIDKNKEDA